MINTPTIDRLDWGNLPTEIVRLIFENLDYECDYLNYQLVNKQWYFASLGVVYKTLTINEDLTEDYGNWKRLESICMFLKNPSYNIGHYIKELTFELTNNNLHILGLIMDRCPNVEKIYVTPNEMLNKYISSAQENGTVVVWRKLRKVHSLIYEDARKDFYHLLYLFRHSVQNLHLLSAPTILTSNESDGEDEQASGTEEDVYAYLKEFKSLKILKLEVNFMNYCLLDWEKLLEHCSATLDELNLNLSSDNSSADILSLSQTQLQASYAYNPFPSLKTLILEDYKPQSPLLEFMNMKHKFVNLKEIIVNCKYGVFWEPLSSLIIDIIAGYVFTIPKFKLSIGSRINLEMFKRFFEPYMKRTEKRTLIIDFSKEQAQGIKFTNDKRNWAIESTPQMHISFNERLFQHPGNQQAIEEFKKILKYVGPYLQTLKLNRGSLYINRGDTVNRTDSFDAKLMDKIFSACPNLHGLVLNIGRFIKCYTVGKAPPVGLRIIEFRKYTKFEDGFFNPLSIRLSNLNFMTVSITGNDRDKLQLDQIHMPFTNFTHLLVKLTDVVLEEEEIVVSISTKDGNNISQYYQCFIPVNTDYCKRKLKLTLITVPPKTNTIIFRITCSTIKTFTLESALDDCVLHL